MLEVRCALRLVLCGTSPLCLVRAVWLIMCGSRYERPAGLFITAFVYVVYLIALRYEGYVIRLRLYCSSTNPVYQAVHGHDLLYPRREGGFVQKGALNEPAAVFLSL